MKVTVKHNNSGLTSEDKKMYNDFIKFLNKNYPVDKELTILFLGKKSGHMSTGSQNINGTIKVLSKNRLNRDIMRTLAHEWVHAHQRLVLGRERGPDIGGQNEDEANAFAGRLIKMFEESYPQYNSLVFESTSKLLNNISLLTEQILLTEKEEMRNDFLLEMKKIGIEKLPYSYSAMKQFVDPETMNIHYNKHYKGYVKKLNDALSKKNYRDLSLEDIIKSINKFDEKVRNNAGGAFNHALFWKMLSPKKQRPSGEVFELIRKQYGNIKKLKDEFNQTAIDRFGSGWAWLVLTKTNKLKIMSTPNQDNPLMNIIKDGGYPLLGLDVWEHAYYLKYRNKRDEYIKNFWNHVNWEFVNDLYLKKIGKKNLNESFIKKQLNEAVTSFPLHPKTFRKLINDFYPKCDGQVYSDGCLGSINTEDCTTEDGIIGGKFTEQNYGGNGNWSIINRFDTNSKVQKEIGVIWKEETNGSVDFKTWIKDNLKNLIGNDGIYTERLSLLNKETIISGKKNESYARNILIRTFKLNPEEEGMSWKIIERCAGDIRDRKLGQDFDVTIDGVSYFIQVKPTDYTMITKVGSERGYYYKLPSWHEHTKYQEQNVDLIVYVDRPNDKYIIFKNDFSRIQTVSNPKKFPKFYVIYYENPIDTNMNLETELEPDKIESKPKLVKDKEKEAEYFRERLKYYQDKLRELGATNEISEGIIYYKTKLKQLIN